MGIDQNAKSQVEGLGGIGADFEFDTDSWTPGGTSESQESEIQPESGVGVEKKKIRWGQLHTEILEAWLVDDDVWGGPAMVELAKRLRGSPDEFAMIISEIGEEELALKRMERLLEAERIRNKDVNWDRLEDAVLSKLDAAVRKGELKKPAELLAVAQVANRAVRRSQGGGGMGNHTTINLTNGEGGKTAISLPGAGQLGSMTLTLSAKTVSQLGKGITTIDAIPNKFSDSIEMLGGKDVPQLSKLADES